MKKLLVILLICYGSFSQATMKDCLNYATKKYPNNFALAKTICEKAKHKVEQVRREAYAQAVRETPYVPMFDAEEIDLLLMDRL